MAVHTHTHTQLNLTNKANKKEIEKSYLSCHETNHVRDG